MQVPRCQISLSSSPSSDLVARALFDQAESVEASYFSPCARATSYELFAKSFSSITTDEAAAAKERKKLEDYFDIINELLDRQDYMAGNKYTLVDIYHIPLVQRLFTCGNTNLVGERRNVNAWWQRCLSRPAMKSYIKEMIIITGCKMYLHRRRQERWML
jgi:glutathione S-transferase